ncbi:MAG TPA: cbb3-type cytochrome c oxidase subunit 3, partial [Roseovarius sp.]|nr:cbb3-type cytochrome c oxidase subunit 3 [Roseovarius sp.]
METYSLLRQFADSWMLLVLFVFFIGVVIFVFRPGSTKKYENPSNIPFRHEDKPA